MTSQRHASATIPLTVVGCDFRRASSRWRSRLVLDREELRGFHRELRSAGGVGGADGVDGLLALQTCNRNEWVAAGSDPRWAAGLLAAQMKHRAGGGEARWFEPYVHTGTQALRHLLRVSLGRESLVLGEQQIAGQLHDSLEEARAAGTSSRALNHLGPVTGRLLRAARARTDYGTTGRGVHSLALKWLRRRLRPSTSQPALVAIVGIGSIGRQLLGMVEREPGLKPVAINRSPAGSEVQPWAALPEVLARAAAAVLCTGARAPLFDPRQLLAQRVAGPLAVLDLGIPHQADRTLTHPALELEGLDELCAQHAAEKSSDTWPCREDLALGTLIDRAVAEYRILCAGAGVGELLDTVRRQHRQAVYRDIPLLVNRNFGHLTERERTRLEDDLQRILRDCADEVFRGIKSSSLGAGSGPPAAGAATAPPCPTTQEYSDTNTRAFLDERPLS
ncbi:MAG TPA: hypothetical protein QF730_06370 [Planctomycetota bacterium]|nr:hypothetical protein [Planctomycetota bacterium]